MTLILMLVPKKMNSCQGVRVRVSSVEEWKMDFLPFKIIENEID